MTPARDRRPAAHGARPIVPRLATDLARTRRRFEVVSRLRARRATSRPRSSSSSAGSTQGRPDVVLLGATGTGKSATTAWLVEKVQRPTLVMAPNKTLAAQLANEFRELLPHNAVEYFVCYYDYYQPEAYVPQTDTYIEKDSSVNEEVERLRHSATMSLLTRRDVIVVASVSCIYGLGHAAGVRRPDGPAAGRRHASSATSCCAGSSTCSTPATTWPSPAGTFRVRGDTVEIFPVYEELAVRVEMFGDEIERVMTLHPLTGEVVEEHEEVFVFPATHYVAGPERMERAIARHRARARRPARRRWRRRASCSRPSGCGCAPPTTSR